jgi:hypothetical protein
LNSDGTVTVNQTGNYLVTGKVQIQPTTTTTTFALQVNGTGGNVPFYNAVSIGPNDSEASITTIMPLTAGTKISLGLISPNTVTLATAPGGGPNGSASTAITITRLS